MKIYNKNVCHVGILKSLLRHLLSLSGKGMRFLFILCSKIGRRLILCMISEMRGPVMKQVFRSSPFIELLRKV